MLPFQLIIRNLSKSYGELQVWNRLNLTLDSGQTYCLMGSSGIGKTTLFRILLELEQPDDGSFSLEPSPGCKLTAVFQEDRLCEAFTPIDNVYLTAGSVLNRRQIIDELSRLLPRESLTRPVSTLSGGMKRRVAIARALLSPSCGILMDEPFTGLDERTRHLVIEYVKEKTSGRLLVVATHQEEDMQALSGILLCPFDVISPTIQTAPPRLC
ncbi:MAG: ABC transporter ATP-binding protein [Lachnospiraceae bacterium]|nr:ABC transporter ATP-binding protein [Lachnospiraceae bacterium]